MSQVLEELVAVLPDIFGHVIRDEQKKEMLKHGTPCRAGGTTAVCLPIPRKPDGRRTSRIAPLWRS